MTPIQRDVFWSGWSAPSLEHLQMIEDESGTGVGSSVMGLLDEQPFQMQYMLYCDHLWRTREINLRHDGKGIILQADGQGNWTTGAGVAVPHLEGCIDCDLIVTPFTNTLPIRRLKLEIGQSADVRVAYLHFPQLQAVPVMQRYTRLSEQRYRFESLESDFTAELEIDPASLVVDYPGLFRRTWIREIPMNNDEQS